MIILPLHDAALFVTFIFVYIWREKLEHSLFLVDEEIIICLQFALGVPRNFVRGVKQIQLRTEDRENVDLGAVAP